MAQPILQFGTSRFLLAHVDLFVSEALAQGDAGKALGGITLVQSTSNPASAARVAALAGGAGYPVRIRGLAGGERVDRTVQCTAVKEAVQADAQWPQLRQAFVHDVQVVVSNTADRGYQLDDSDNAALLADTSPAPRSFPAKLLVLLHGRWQANPQAPLSLLPCELIEKNGEVLRDLVMSLAAQWQLDTAFIAWLRDHCVWANSLVDRIVSEAIEPVGAVAEPYALWAIEAQPRLVLPCVHPAIVLTDDLARHERLKLFLLNAAHTWLAERWQLDGRPADETVRAAMADTALRTELEALWLDEIVPVFVALGEGAAAMAYLVDLRERLENPFLDHRIADIAQNHAQKKQRRLAPIVTMAAEHAPLLKQPRLLAALANVATPSGQAS
ncbi:mannitol dehydrogenase family protein [Pigmentiphaga aceris]|uniref:Mannitol dehydrogenase family protein n=1 Tax=Pigmentiphaga aceris TaxID=1940612 RepID=A0A5C0B1A5_9BURK|nr:mannitol dehydrogenase family protein [Pigmentiphaga aceris]QEI07644.1 mannitol dehydrogenase family protein [Pigmentiphaga aceris]